MLQELLNLVYPRERADKTEHSEQMKPLGGVVKSRRIEVRRVPKAMVGPMLDQFSSPGFRRMDRIERWKAAQILTQQ